MIHFEQPHSFVDAGAERLAYYRFGRGPDVVLVHGWPLHAATFRNIAPALAEEFTVHAFDLPGAGRSDARGPVGVDLHGATVRRAIDRLGLARFAYLAHDSGGAIARFAAKDDRRVRGMVLAGTEIPHHSSPMIQAYAAAARIPGVSRLIFAAMAIGAVRRSALGFGGCFRDPAYVDGEFGQLFVRPLIDSAKVAAAQLALLRSLDLRVLHSLEQVHARIAAPVLCIWGSDDPFFPIERARAMLPQFAGGATLVEIAGARLFTHEDHPQAFVAHAAPFLARCLAAESDVEKRAS